MKVILEFDLPDEKPEFELAQNGPKYYCILCDIREFLRKKSKYENKKSVIIEDIYALLEDVEE